MKKVKRKMNRRAVSAPLEFTIAFGVFLIGSTFLLYSASSLFAVYETPEPDLRTKAIEISDMLISSPGYPDWVNYTNDIQRLGFAVNSESNYELDKYKIDNFFTMDESNTYELFRSALGLNKLDLNYQFNISIYTYGDQSRFYYGKNFFNYTSVQTFKRSVLIGRSIAQLEVAVFI